MEGIWNLSDSSSSWPSNQTKLGKKDLGQGGDQERPQWPLWQNYRVPWLRWENLLEGQSLRHFTNLGFFGEWPDWSHSWKKGTWQHAWSLQKVMWKAESMRQKILWSDEMKIELWPECKALRLVETEHSSSPINHHPYPEAWWWQHHAMGMLFSSRNWETCKDRWNNEWSQIQENPWGEPASECKRALTAAKVYVPTFFLNIQNFHFIKPQNLLPHALSLSRAFVQTPGVLSGAIFLRSGFRLTTLPKA